MPGPDSRFVTPLSIRYGHQQPCFAGELSRPARFRDAQLRPIFLSDCPPTSCRQLTASIRSAAETERRSRMRWGNCSPNGLHNCSMSCPRASCRRCPAASLTGCRRAGSRCSRRRRAGRCAQGCLTDNRRTGIEGSPRSGLQRGATDGIRHCTRSPERNAGRGRDRTPAIGCLCLTGGGFRIRYRRGYKCAHARLLRTVHQ